MNEVKLSLKSKASKKCNKQKYNKHWKKQFKESIPLYMIMAVPLLFFIVIRYVPMYGLQIAFKDYRAIDGIWGSAWTGMENIMRFVSSYNFWDIIKNTITLSLYQLIVAFPLAICFALVLNSARNGKFKKMVQLITYAPHFISVVVMCGIILQLLAPRTGLINIGIEALGFEQKDFIGMPEMFSSIYVWSGVWQNVGWGTIIYLSALSSIDTELYEAAAIDGASKFNIVRHIDLMGILPMIITMLIMDVGRLLQVGFQKILLLQNGMNISNSEVIQTYAYKIGLAAQIPNFSYSAAIGLFTSVINFILLVTVNKIAKKVGNSSLW
ncbi:ABC transporter permease [Candidatus Epulonipiscium viviparus]|uniref:ABC transporter permease n=1 Tax=Candidatus Epulonipiscium viviparus TaxID=420336 RepID=UPI000498296C|nr:ABC transporter permease subunit [Candidatus Epulopiscium viviparus]